MRWAVSVWLTLLNEGPAPIERGPKQRGVVPQTGLALMGFSRSCPSSLDLLKLVLRGCRGAAGELVLSDPGPAQLGSSLAQARFLEIWNSGDLEIQKFGIQKIKK